MFWLCLFLCLFMRVVLGRIQSLRMRYLGEFVAYLLVYGFFVWRLFAGMDYSGYDWHGTAVVTEVKEERRQVSGENGLEYKYTYFATYKFTDGQGVEHEKQLPPDYRKWEEGVEYPVHYSYGSDKAVLVFEEDSESWSMLLMLTSVLVLLLLEMLVNVAFVTLIAGRRKVVDADMED